MKRYRFPLNTVLRVRQSQEEIAGATLSEANRQVVASNQALDATVQRHEQRPPITGPMNATTFTARQARGAWSAAAIRDAEIMRSHAEGQADHARELWQEAARRVKALQRLDDRRRAEHHVLAERAGDREADHIVVGRHGRER